jgi:uncharacterized protein
VQLTGYASVTEKPYSMGFYDETVARGAFKKTLGENPDVQLLINHTGLPLARTRAQTMQLLEDDKGLWVVADLDEGDPDAVSLVRKMQRGLVDQMSFSFQAMRQNWNQDYTQRRILECNIHRGDVSVVNQGANPNTSTLVRSRDGLDAKPISRTTLEERRSMAKALGKRVELRAALLDITGAPMVQRSYSIGAPQESEEEKLQEFWRQFHKDGEDLTSRKGRMEALRYRRRA